MSEQRHVYGAFSGFLIAMFFLAISAGSQSNGDNVGAYLAMAVAIFAAWVAIHLWMQLIDEWADPR